MTHRKSKTTGSHKSSKIMVYVLIKRTGWQFLSNCKIKSGGALCKMLGGFQNRPFSLTHWKLSCFSPKWSTEKAKLQVSTRNNYNQYPIILYYSIIKIVISYNLLWDIIMWKAILHFSMHIQFTNLLDIAYIDRFTKFLLWLRSIAGSITELPSKRKCEIPECGKATLKFTAWYFLKLNLWNDLYTMFLLNLSKLTHTHLLITNTIPYNKILRELQIYLSARWYIGWCCYTRVTAIKSGYHQGYPSYGHAVLLQVDLWY